MMYRACVQYRVIICLIYIFPVIRIMVSRERLIGCAKLPGVYLEIR